MKKKVLASVLLASMCASLLAGCGGSDSASSDNQVVVYNWGEYIDPDVLDEFEEETGIKVVYEEFETNEIHVSQSICRFAVAYDVVCPSDYMISSV